MNEIRDALSRKLGPLPAWAWAGISFLLLYYYRNRNANKTISTANTPAGLNTSPTAPPIPLAPGESVYDPNTGQLITTPTGEPPPGGLVPPGFTGNGGAGEAGSGASPTPGAPTPPSPSAPTTHPRKRKPVGTILGPHGAKVLAYGHNKPKAPRGTRVVGVGSGEWISIPIKAGKRLVKRKPKSTKPVAKPPTNGKKRSRSSAAIRNPVGGRTTVPVQPVPARGRNVVPVQQVPYPATGISRTSPVGRGLSNLRQRPVAPVASHPVVKQRPVASNPPTKQVTHAGNPPRPSAPPPRKTRQPTAGKKHK